MPPTGRLLFGRGEQGVMLTGELTNLRAVERSDGGLLHDWLDDPEAMSWWGQSAPVVSLNLVRERLEQWLADEVVFGFPVAFIIESLDHEEIGLILLSDIQMIDRSVELSIVLGSRYREQGLGSDALATLVGVAFEQWGLHRVTVRSEAANTRAHRFFEHNGFRLEGRLREARFLDSGWSDILIFGCIRADEQAK